ncbi:MAG: Bax inhibitor-1/YccA family protein [Bacilli bacterium]|nr:Bax inhibitor-1/YccA family protein [Bacilli bacterium]
MESKFVSGVFLWMFIGLLITFGTGYYVSLNKNMLYNLFSGGMYLFLALIEIVIAIVLSTRINKMNPLTAKILFCLYSFVTGLTFSSIFVVYKLESVISVFLVTSLIFLVFSIIGYITKLDLSKFSTYLFMGLIGILLCSIINIFIGSDAFTTFISCIGVVIFIGMTAYDVWKLKYYDPSNENNTIICAFGLYLDFINIFIYLLRLFGKRDD